MEGARLVRRGLTSRHELIVMIPKAGTDLLRLMAPLQSRAKMARGNLGLDCPAIIRAFALLVQKRQRVNAIYATLVAFERPPLSRGDELAAVRTARFLLCLNQRQTATAKGCYQNHEMTSPVKKMGARLGL